MCMPGVKKEQLKVSKPASTLDKAAVQEEMVASEQTQRLAQVRSGPAPLTCAEICELRL